MKCLLVESLAEGIPVVACGNYWYYISKCLVAFSSQGHTSGAMLRVDFNGVEKDFEVLWDSDVTQLMYNTGADLVRSAEDSACAIAFLLVRELTPYTAVEQARRFSGIDYYLSYKERDDDLLFNHAACLEVSGVLKGSDSVVMRRVNEKRQRLKKYRYENPVYIVVVEHSRPISKVVICDEPSA